MSGSTTPAARHALYSVLEDVLGDEHADTLMTYLPTHPSDQVATKADIAAIREDLARLEARFDRLEEKLDAWQRATLTAIVASMVGMTAIFSLVVTIFA